jgi:hypothetical protein
MMSRKTVTTNTTVAMSGSVISPSSQYKNGCLLLKSKHWLVHMRFDSSQKIKILVNWHRDIYSASASP